MELLTDIAGFVYKGLNSALFHIGEEAVSLMSILTSIAIVVGSYYIARLCDEAIERAAHFRELSKESSVQITRRIVRYLILSTGFILAIQNIGVNVEGLFTAGAIFAVGIGFAMQQIAQNFVSGVILLVERSIKQGDVLEVNGRVVRVVEMGIRSTVARTWDDEELIIPNSSLVQDTVTNYTLTDSFYRVRAQVGVHYQSDMERVRKVLTETARNIPWRIKRREPVILLTQFGSSSVDWEVSVWMDDPWTLRPARSELMRAMWNALKEEDITIAFPQLDVHFDAPFAGLQPVPTANAPAADA